MGLSPAIVRNSLFINIKNWGPQESKVNWREYLLKEGGIAWTYLQLPLRQWGTSNVYLLVLSSWKVNIAENPIAEMGL